MLDCPFGEYFFSGIEQCLRLSPREVKLRSLAGKEHLRFRREDEVSKFARLVVGQREMDVAYSRLPGDA